MYLINGMDRRREFCPSRPLFIEIVPQCGKYSDKLISYEPPRMADYITHHQREPMSTSTCAAESKDSKGSSSGEIFDVLVKWFLYPSGLQIKSWQIMVIISSNSLCTSDAQVHTRTWWWVVMIHPSIHPHMTFISRKLAEIQSVQCSCLVTHLQAINHLSAP